MKYEVKLSNFEGPLDLLLHLISKARIEPQEIFVSQITEQYLGYMEQTEDLDLDTASDFLQMAATLLYIKSRSLLPRMREEDLDESGMTPEEVLIARLNEYKRYKDAAEALQVLSEDASAYLYKLPEEFPAAPEGVEAAPIEGNPSDLAAAFRMLLRKLKSKDASEPEVIIPQDSFSIRRQTKMILARLMVRPKLFFKELLEDETNRAECSVTFMALLELLHSGRVAVMQKQTFGTISIQARR